MTGEWARYSGSEEWTQPPVVAEPEDLRDSTYEPSDHDLTTGFRPSVDLERKLYEISHQNRPQQGRRPTPWGPKVVATAVLVLVVGTLSLAFKSTVATVLLGVLLVVIVADLFFGHRIVGAAKLRQPLDRDRHGHV